MPGMLFIQNCGWNEDMHFTFNKMKYNVCTIDIIFAEIISFCDSNIYCFIKNNTYSSSH